MAPEGDVDLPAAAGLTDGRFLFHVFQDGLSRLMVGNPDTPPRLVGFDDGTTSLMAVDERHGDVLVAHTGATQPRGLYRVHLDDGLQKLIFQRGSGGNASTVVPIRVTIPVSGGTNLPIYVWRAGPQPSRGVAIEFPVSRRLSRHVDPTFDGADQYIVQQGYDYIKFGFLPTTDRSEGWEFRLTEGDLTSALAVVDYALRTLGAPPNKVVLFGESAGIAYVLPTAARMHDKSGGLVLRGVGALGSLQMIEEFSDHHFRIAVLQGENDAFPPAVAKAHIEGLFGANSLGGSNGFLRVLEDEGHTPRFLQSRALVSAAVFQLLAAPQ